VVVMKGKPQHADWGDLRFAGKGRGGRE
jgi:hypothetical protein